MRKITFGLFMMLAAAAAAGLAQEAKPDVGGTWEVTFESPMGVRTYIAVFVQDQDALKVMMKSPQGTELKGEGRIQGLEASWSVVVNDPMGEILLAFKGKIDGETMSGTLNMGDAGETDFRAKRTSKSIHHPGRSHVHLQ
jgi:hypothetical protein